MGSNSAGERGCLSLVGSVFCQVGVSATGRSLVQRSPTEVVCLTVTQELHRGDLVSLGLSSYGKYIMM